MVPWGWYGQAGCNGLARAEGIPNIPTTDQSLTRTTKLLLSNAATFPFDTFPLQLFEEGTEGGRRGGGCGISAVIWHLDWSVVPLQKPGLPPTRAAGSAPTELAWGSRFHGRCLHVLRRAAVLHRPTPAPLIGPPSAHFFFSGLGYTAPLLHVESYVTFYLSVCGLFFYGCFLVIELREEDASVLLVQKQPS